MVEREEVKGQMLPFLKVDLGFFNHPAVTLLHTSKYGPWHGTRVHIKKTD